MGSKKDFIAYASSPQVIGEAIEPINKSLTEYKTWSQMDVLGNSINQEIWDAIDNCDNFVGDISVLNHNVIYEIGYAIGKKKNILLTSNKAVNEASKEHIKEIGIFDTLGYKEYQNSIEFRDILQNEVGQNRIKFESNLQDRTSTPIYLLEAKIKTDQVVRITSKIKKSALGYRSFDPVESTRLSPMDAISSVASSIAVVVSWLPESMSDSFNHNIRASFLAGLAHGMGKILYILQIYDSKTPIDLKESGYTCATSEQLDKLINILVVQVTKELQKSVPKITYQSKTILEEINLGASAAENEFKDLSSYYFKTDQYNRVLRGEARIVCGRKGSGKTALFSQVRNKLREDKKNIVIDLKPESYQLIKFKEEVLSLLQVGTYEHTLVAFWEYILLLEVCYKLLEKDQFVYMRDPRLMELYTRLQELYKVDDYSSEGDFSERISRLIESISEKLKTIIDKEKTTKLSNKTITEVIYKHSIADLKNNLKEYLRQKKSVWVLIDNIDKGWAADGLTEGDLVIVRTLLNAMQKLEQQLTTKDIDCKTVLFLRNDVYELLIDVTADRGKDSKILLDWNDPEALSEIIKRRLVYSGIGNDESEFSDIWRTIAVSHVKGEESFSYILDRTLMRPRALIDCLKLCIGTAINRGNSKVEESDILEGVRQFSLNVSQDISCEIRDVFPRLRDKDALFMFIAHGQYWTKTELNELYSSEGITDECFEKLTDFLLWYGVLGLTNKSDTLYIYDTSYNLALLKRRSTAWKLQEPLYTLYPTFSFDNESL